ncbi:DUF4190 domain-containing protein [Microbacterium halotolerans]|uniref:DUF4190 domain-containing protein n=1 Tax=Microbacterium halotolerans TaxID=246613 RepID=UPI000E6ADE62|nr:DUF4190 domain-containing protein [Microbacterium halotolerans]
MSTPSRADDPAKLIEELTGDQPSAADPRVDPRGAAGSRAEQRAAREREGKRRHDPREPKRWKPPQPLAGWALMCAMFGLSMSWFMPWAMPASVLGVILGSVALSRRWEDRASAGWALGLGIVGTASAAFWIVWIYNALQTVPAA